MMRLSQLPLANANDEPPAIRSYWVVPGKFLAGAYPGSPDAGMHRQRITSLWNAGLRTFINLMEEHERNNNRQRFTPYDDILRELAVGSSELATHTRIAVRDLSVPTNDVMRSILDAIDQSLIADRPVYLHCFGGVGRTGTVVCCWLLRHGHASTSANVIQLLHALRQAHLTAKDRPAPETSEQLGFVEGWQEPGQGSHYPPG